MSLLKTFVARWVSDTFGLHSLMDRKNRAARVLEEACELAQAEGITEEQVNKITARTYSRPVGEPAQEVAGIRFTLYAYEVATGIDAEDECEKELARVRTLPVNHFRRKQIEKYAAGTDYAHPLNPGPDDIKDFDGRPGAL